MRTVFVANMFLWGVNPWCQHRTRVPEPIIRRDGALLSRRRAWCPQTAQPFRRPRSAGGCPFRMELHDDAEAPRVDFDDTDLNNAQSASIGDSNSPVTPASMPSSARKTKSRRTRTTREGDLPSAVEHASPNAMDMNGPSLTPEPTSSDTSTSRSKPRRTGQKSGQEHLAREVASASALEDATTGKMEAQQTDDGMRAASKTGSQRRSRKSSTEKEMIDAAPSRDSSKEPLNGTLASGTSSRGKTRSASRSRSKTSNISEGDQTVAVPEQSERSASIRSDTPSLGDNSDERVPAERSSDPSTDRRLKERSSSRVAGRGRSTSSKAASFATPKSKSVSHQSSITYDNLFAPASEGTVGADTNDEGTRASMGSSTEGLNFIPDWPDDADGDDLIADMRSPHGDPSAQISNREASTKHTPVVPDPEVSGRGGLDDMIGAIEEPWDPELLERARQRVQAKHPLGRSELIGESYKPLPSNPSPEPTEQELLIDDSTSHEYLPLIAPGSPFQKAYQRLIHSNISYKELDRWSQGGQPPRVLGVLFGPSNPPPVPIPGQRIETGEGPPLPLPDRMVWKVHDQRPADVSNADLLTDIGFASSSDEDIEQALEDLLQRDCADGWMAAIDSTRIKRNGRKGSLIAMKIMKTIRRRLMRSRRRLPSHRNVPAERMPCHGTNQNPWRQALTKMIQLRPRMITTHTSCALPTR
ncbi:hypothetical protein F1559_002104 [Cyanidiococcus yangmingshanensis]|uniref:Uncharacterized protein n=1 Tax=Cyanidiococcus yangmingshanensis TaxID=2690220 RepID=A0A7J7IEG2_9RHOD|nr:hypothetical protein F1559_002104 [Cyanidiococcus yangmingshanensis]